MKKVLFVIHDLHLGGAEKVLVNLLNHMDKHKFDISVLALLGGGINEQFLLPEIHLIHGHKKVFPGNSHLMKLFSPQTLFKYYIRDKYDIIVSYLEGPSARIVSGCSFSNVKLVSWIHTELYTMKRAAKSFRSPAEAKQCYEKFDRTICVSNNVAASFQALFSLEKIPEVLYNTVESSTISLKGRETVEQNLMSPQEIKLVGVGKLVPNKGFDRLLHIHKRLRTEDRLPVHTYLLGEGSERKKLEQWVQENCLQESVTFLGYQTNPYKYVAKCDLFVCASLVEGFSTAATEALIVGTPVCTVDVSGMKEMLGENNEYGLVVPNDDASLYQGIKKLLDEPELLAHYKRQAQLRGKDFSTERTVQAVEEMLMNLEDNKR